MFVAGLVLGLSIAACVHIYRDGNRVQWISKTPVIIAFGGNANVPVVIPSGTTFYHDSFFSEGFDQLVLYVNASSADRFEVKRVDYVHPYWIPE